MKRCVYLHTAVVVLLLTNIGGFLTIIGGFWQDYYDIGVIVLTASMVRTPFDSV